VSKTDKEKAYLYDLYIVPTWRETYDTVFNEQVGLPKEGRILVVNCGTGGHSLELAAAVAGKGDVVAVSSDQEKLELGRAKAQIQHVSNISFDLGEPPALDYDENTFDMVVADATMMMLSYDIEELVTEMVRVTKTGATIVLQLATRSSFDEFFSIYWEALHECGLEEFSQDVESLITERLTIADAEALLKHAGLKKMKTVQKKREFLFDNAEQFLTSPIIEDVFFDTWMEVLPDSDTADRVRHAIGKIIDRERKGQKFDVSIKATTIWGQKE
jgi:ubiquinone/menaquinone biosynthesis C-methylase UbiE